MSPPASRATTTRRPSTHRPAWGRRSVSGWGRVEPLGHRRRESPGRGPDPLDSIQYALDFQHLKAIGSVNSALRTPEQTEIAKFWAEGAPAGWNRIANTVIQQMDSTRGTLRGFSPSSTSRWPTASSPALMPVPLPVLAAIRGDPEGRRRRESVDECGSRLEAAVLRAAISHSSDTGLSSNHTVVGAAAAEVLAHYFGDRVSFSTSSTSLPGVTRSFRTFTEAAVENGLSRAYAGIHFLRAIADGYWQGRGIGRSVERLLPPVQ